jgi:putative oxidoreductase
MITYDFAKLYIRIYVAFMLLFHGVHKVLNGIDFIFPLVAKVGWPSYVAYGVYAGEIVAPLMLLVGFFPRVAAGLIVFTLGCCIYLTHMEALLKIDQMGGWAMEPDMTYIFPCVLLIIIGGGKYCLSLKSGKKK